MIKLYGVYWDNGEEWAENHATDIYAVCKTEKLANRLADKLTLDLGFASCEVERIEKHNGSYKDISAILRPWNKIGIYTSYGIDNYSFYVKELDYYDSKEEL